jgi:hypothetical protein
MDTSTDTYKLTTAAVDAVLAHVPGEWTTDQNNAWYVTATRADGLTFGFHVERYGNTPAKAQVTLSAPYKHLRYDETAPRINATMTRPADKVAADIIRRLLPDAEPFHATIVERIAAAETYAAAVETNVSTLAEVDGVTPRNSRTDPRNDTDMNRVDVRRGDVFGHATVSRDQAAIELHGLPIGLAREVLALIASRTSNTPADA